MKKLIYKQWRLLLFGFLLSFFSVPGQTFFISLFGGVIREDLSISNAQFGGIYSLATLASAAMMIVTGPFVDKVDLKKFSIIITVLLSIGCFAMSFTLGSVTLLICLFLLRHCGQGLMSLTGITAMVRYIPADSGKATALSTMGYTLAKAFTPSVIIIVMVNIGWRASWQIISLILLITVIPLILFLLKDHASRHDLYLKQSTFNENDSSIGEQPQWTRKQVLGDRRFYLYMPALLAQPMLFTGFIFHQIPIIEAKNWTLMLWGQMFVAYAIASIIFSIIAGYLIDRYGAKQLLSIANIPLGLALLLLAFSVHPINAMFVLLLMGITSGIIGTVSGPFWSQLYGRKHLGAIKSLGTTMMVFSSALAPFIIGWFIDAGVLIQTISLVSATYVMLSCGLAFFATRYIESTNY